MNTPQEITLPFGWVVDAELCSFRMSKPEKASGITSVFKKMLKMQKEKSYNVIAYITYGGKEYDLFKSSTFLHKSPEKTLHETYLPMQRQFSFPLDMEFACRSHITFKVLEITSGKKAPDLAGILFISLLELLSKIEKLKDPLNETLTLPLQSRTDLFVRFRYIRHDPEVNDGSASLQISSFSARSGSDLLIASNNGIICCDTLKLRGLSQERRVASLDEESGHFSRLLPIHDPSHENKYQILSIAISNGRIYTQFACIHNKNNCGDFLASMALNGTDVHIHTRRPKHFSDSKAIQPFTSLFIWHKIRAFGSSQLFSSKLDLITDHAHKWTGMNALASEAEGTPLVLPSSNSIVLSAVMPHNHVQYNWLKFTGPIATVEKGDPFIPTLGFMEPYTNDEAANNLVHFNTYIVGNDESRKIAAMIHRSAAGITASIFSLHKVLPDNKLELICFYRRLNVSLEHTKSTGNRFIVAHGKKAAVAHSITFDKGSSLHPRESGIIPLIDLSGHDEITEVVPSMHESRVFIGTSSGFLIVPTLTQPSAKVQFILNVSDSAIHRIIEIDKSSLILVDAEGHVFKINKTPPSQEEMPRDHAIQAITRPIDVLDRYFIEEH